MTSPFKTYLGDITAVVTGRSEDYGFEHEDWERFEQDAAQHLMAKLQVGGVVKDPTEYNWKATQKDLENKGVRVLSAGADEVPGVYKDIEDVMREQADLVEIVARFDPRIVKMCDDGSKAED